MNRRSFLKTLVAVAAAAVTPAPAPPPPDLFTLQEFSACWDISWKMLQESSKFEVYHHWQSQLLVDSPAAGVRFEDIAEGAEIAGEDDRWQSTPLFR